MRMDRPVRIVTERFFLRELTPRDASGRYLAWLRDPAVARFIASASDTPGLDTLREYINARCSREDVLFLGIFDAVSALHVGNVKFEPLDVAAGYAVVGILIGEPAYRGVRVGYEVLQATGRYLKDVCGIKEVALGVHEANAGAIRSYSRVGFKVAATPHIPAPQTGSLTMVWRP
jgi:[ribosomal protein S5]-alanine N-acetyltransferase